MNVDVIGRIRPSLRGEHGHSLQVDSHNRVASRPGGTYFSFQTLFRSESTNYDIYKSQVHSLLELCVAGYNVCLLTTGESGSGKSYSVAGETLNKSGIVPILLDHLFAKVNEEDHRMYGNNHDFQRSTVSIQMYEIYNETIRDLMQTSRGSSSDYLELDENAEKGTFVKGGLEVPIHNSSDAIQLFREGWNRRNETITDFGPATKHANIIIYIDLTLHSGDNPLPNKSRFTVALLSGSEKLDEDTAYVRMSEGPNLSKSILSVSQLADTLSNQPYANRIINYSKSKVTQMMKDELGGNCKTRVLVCLKPDSENLTPLLRMSSALSKVKNFPVMNDCWAQSLVTQYRARIIDLQLQLGLGTGYPNPGLHDAREELQKLRTDNLQLKDKEERLFHRLEQMQGRYGHLSTSKTDLSAQLLMSEEEKLKVSQGLVEMQIANNKLQEEMEATKFELTNKILSLENEIMELELDRDKQVKFGKNSKGKFAELERDRKDLADEYVVLKTNYLSLTKEHEKEVAKNEELSMELLNLVNAKAAMMRQLDTMETASGHYGDPGQEVDRIRQVVSRLSVRRYKPDEFQASVRDRENVEKSLFGNQKHLEGEMSRLRDHYDETQTKLEGKLGAMKKELQDARNIARERQQKIAELNAKLITTTSAREQLQSQVNRSQHKLRDMNEEYRSRLIKYVEDISNYVDGGSGVPDSEKTGEKLTAYINKMLKDIRAAHKVREEQLSNAAQTYKSRINELTRRHEELLVAYRLLRNQVEARGLGDLDLGPDEWHLQMTDPELRSVQQKEVDSLREKLESTRNELESLKTRMRMRGGDFENSTGGILKKTGTVSFADSGTENWSSLRKKLREFTLNTQTQLEEERAQLLSENHALREQLSECQGYIDSHLIRYKQEIVRLREMLGIENDGRIGSGSPLFKKNRSKKTP